MSSTTRYSAGNSARAAYIAAKQAVAFKRRFITINP